MQHKSKADDAGLVRARSAKMIKVAQDIDVGETSDGADDVEATEPAPRTMRDVNGGESRASPPPEQRQEDGARGTEDDLTNGQMCRLVALARVHISSNHARVTGATCHQGSDLSNLAAAIVRPPGRHCGDDHRRGQRYAMRAVCISKLDIYPDLGI